MRETGRKFKDEVYGQFARIGKAVSSPKRLEILDVLCQGERTVEVLAREAGTTVANASRHLQILRSARLVECEKRGLFVTYRLADQAVCDFFHGLRRLAENRLAELDAVVHAFMTRPEDLEAIDRASLLERVRDGRVVLLDVRPSEEYRAGHLSGARSVPLRELAHRLAELPRVRQIVAYCRGPYCVLALEAVEILRARGFRASRLPDGPPEWRALGLPLESPDNGIQSRSPRVEESP
ncbi:MAG: metalloregulator ArsR/SmtB family transcription factor [Acidobacteria bacterium]|nr:metalloregulator ArsR/SmtB family transcription factor [Acidobacteriota bacterium]